MSAESYYLHHKELAKRLFIEGVNLSNNPENLPRWKLESRLNRVIISLSELGYDTTLDGLKHQSQGGFVNEMDDLKLYYQLATVLNLPIPENSYPSPFVIKKRLARLGLGRLCTSCRATGLYTLASGASAVCASCNGTTRVVSISSKTLEQVKGLKGVSQ